MIETVSLLPVLDKKLIEVLRDLSPEDWNRPTIAPLWTVKDIAAHLLDGNIRTLCLARDQHVLMPDRNIDSYQTLVDYLNQLNAEWVKAMKRVSPGMLVDLLEQTGREYSAYMASLDPNGQAIFSVAWAGESVSSNWFHIAREYTEKWHHQQQIREATGRPGIITKELFPPFIETLLSALPHTYRNTTAPNGTSIEISVSTDVGGKWWLTRNGDWSIGKQAIGKPAASMEIPPDVSWKLFTKGMKPGEAAKFCKIGGDVSLASVTLQLIAIMG